jgi:3-oxoacyl-[acyl-carrier protein] reductase
MLKGKNILLTGASQGLGQTIARTLWARGASLLLVARTASLLEQLRDELERARNAADQTVNLFTADLSQSSAPEQIAGEARRIWDRVDVLVNNAAMQGPIGPLWENDPAAWEKTMRVNLLAPVSLCRVLLPEMIQRRAGKIINLSGGGATGPRVFFTAYGTAKAALVRFTETLAHEVREHNIQANAIAPGAMNTRMHQAVLEAGPAAAGEKEYKQAVKQAETGGTSPERPAELCAFLASDASGTISGRLLSAVWDPWEHLPEHESELAESDIYTLRRIVPADRGKAWE